MTSESDDKIAATLDRNAQRVRERVAAAAAQSGRRSDDVRIVAVTKSVEPDIARRLLSLGFADFGENRVQQLLTRAELLGGTIMPLSYCAPLGGPPRWHMIGHVQRNKVKALLRHVRVAHSLDSLRLAEEFERHLSIADAEMCLDAFLEINISGEASKGGIPVDQAPKIAEQVSRLSRIRLVGLMTMAPYTATAEETRPVFAELRRLAERMREKGDIPPTCLELSMGMSNDYPVAIEEGATWVRIGSDLFDGLP